MTIDAHLHAWDRSRSDYAWLDDDSPIARDVLGEEAVAGSVASGFERQLLVQADDTAADSEHLLEVARRLDTVAGVVAWVPLDDVDAATASLDRWGGGVVGVRSLLHVHPDPELLLRPQTARTLAMLAERSLPLDVPDAWPTLVEQAVRVAREHEGLVLVLDHLGKPPADAEALPRWRSSIAELAAIPTSVAKVSGLHHGGRLLHGDVLDAVWETALDLFGPDRLMLGSDAPMPDALDGSAAAARQVLGLAGRLAPGERIAIEQGTAARVYLGRA